MIDFFRAGGPLMWVLLIASMISLSIILERLFSLRSSKVLPDGLLEQVLHGLRKGDINASNLSMIEENSPLGEVLASGIKHRELPREQIKESMEETGKQVTHRLGRYLNTLGTIASITPLIGLLGTVIGMIKVFAVITAAGVGDPKILSGGISEALITTAAGLTVGIPSLMFYRFFRSQIGRHAVNLEEHALAFLDFNAIRSKKTTKRARSEKDESKETTTGRGKKIVGDD